MFTVERGIFSPAIKDLIFDFNQYNHIPSEISNTYVRFVLNHGRLRQKVTYIPTVLYIDTQQRIGIFSEDHVGNKIYLKGI